VHPVAVYQLVVKTEVLAHAVFVAAEELNLFDIESVFVGGVATAAGSAEALGFGVEGDPDQLVVPVFSLKISFLSCHSSKLFALVTTSFLT
jgi:hypothetical protein